MLAKGVARAPGAVNRDTESDSTATVNIPLAQRVKTEETILKAPLKAKLLFLGTPPRPHASHGTQISLLCVVATERQRERERQRGLAFM